MVKEAVGEEWALHDDQSATGRLFAYGHASRLRVGKTRARYAASRQLYR